MASAWVRPVTSRTWRAAGPWETDRVMTAPLGLGVLAVGLWSVTWLIGALVFVEVTTRTMKPAAWSVAFASSEVEPTTLGTGTLPAPALTLSVMVLPLATFSPCPGLWSKILPWSKLSFGSEVDVTLKPNVSSVCVPSVSSSPVTAGTCTRVAEVPLLPSPNVRASRKSIPASRRSSTTSTATKAPDERRGPSS